MLGPHESNDFVFAWPMGSRPVIQRHPFWLGDEAAMPRSVNFGFCSLAEPRKVLFISPLPKGCVFLLGYIS
jgi:hypothetical protein